MRIKPTLAALLLVVSTAVPFAANAINTAERACRRQTENLYYADRQRVSADYYRELADIYAAYSAGLQEAAFIDDEDRRENRQDEVYEEWRNRRREARDHEREARREISDIRRERREECNDLPDDDPSYSSSRSSTSRSSRSSSNRSSYWSWSSTSMSAGFCGDGRCTADEALILCPACAYGTPPEQCRCTRRCPQDCGDYGYNNSYGFSSSFSFQWDDRDINCGNNICENGEADSCPCDAINPQYRYLCTAPCRAGSCLQDCRTI